MITVAECKPVAHVTVHTRKVMEVREVVRVTISEQGISMTHNTHAHMTTHTIMTVTDMHTLASMSIATHTSTRTHVAHSVTHTRQGKTTRQTQAHTHNTSTYMVRVSKRV